MPICAADKKVSGALERLSADSAFLSPFSAIDSSLGFLADTKAISDITKSPFKIISPSSITISI
jgi:hypothetical protein